MKLAKSIRHLMRKRAAKLTSSFCALLLVLGFAGRAHAASIGVLGDTHGDVEEALKAAKAMKESGVKYLVLTGDMVGFEGDPLYEKLSNRELPPSEVPAAKKTLQAKAASQYFALLDGLEKLGYNRSTIVAAWGNHDKAWANNIIEDVAERVNLVTYSADGKGIATIEGKRVMVSHYPQFKIPFEYLPVNALSDDVVLAGKMSSLGYPSERVDLVVFGHTHTPTLHLDERLNAHVFNPGAVTRGHMPGEVHTSAIYNLDTKEATLLHVDPKGAKPHVEPFPGSQIQSKGTSAEGKGKKGHGCASSVAGAIQ